MSYTRVMSNSHNHSGALRVFVFAKEPSVTTSEHRRRAASSPSELSSCKQRDKAVTDPDQVRTRPMQPCQRQAWEQLAAYRLFAARGGDFGGGVLETHMHFIL